MAKKVFSGSVCNVKTTNQTRNFDLVMDSDLNFKSHSKTIEVWIFTGLTVRCDYDSAVND